MPGWRRPSLTGSRTVRTSSTPAASPGASGTASTAPRPADRVGRFVAASGEKGWPPVGASWPPPGARPRRACIAASGTRPTGSALATTPARRSLQPLDQSLSSQHINHREVGPLQAVAVGPSEAVVLNVQPVWQFAMAIPTDGWLLAVAAPCAPGRPSADCGVPLMLRTTDTGRTWRVIHRPPAPSSETHTR